MKEAKNATFLFHRDFMEYHQDRFEDYSLLLFKENELLGVLPANKQGNVIYTHQGLTYGGLICHQKVKFVDVLSMFQGALQFLESAGFEYLHLKMVPRIYHKGPSDELDYVLHQLEAQKFRSDLLTVVVPKQMQLSRDRKAGVKRGQKHALEVKEVQDLTAFWKEILIPNLANKHQTQPVHRIEEIQELKDNFPSKIRQFNVYHEESLIAGTTIFETDQVAHSQYISANTDKNTLGSLDFLHHHLLTQVFHDKPYFDFGTSHEAEGSKINEGLMYWKEGFGARAIAQAFYKVNIKKHNLLNAILL